MKHWKTSAEKMREFASDKSNYLDSKSLGGFEDRLAKLITLGKPYLRKLYLKNRRLIHI